MSRYTVYEADRSGECWDLCQTDDGSYALLSLGAGRAARPRNILGVVLTDDPETRGVEESLEEQELAQAERELEQIDERNRFRQEGDE